MREYKKEIKMTFIVQQPLQFLHSHFIWIHTQINGFLLAPFLILPPRFVETHQGIFVADKQIHNSENIISSVEVIKAERINGMEVTMYLFEGIY